MWFRQFSPQVCFLYKKEQNMSVSVAGVIQVYKDVTKEIEAISHLREIE